MIKLGDLTLYTIEEAAGILHLTRRYVWELIHAGNLKAYRKVGRVIYINETDLLEWLKEGDNLDRKGKADEESK